MHVRYLGTASKEQATWRGHDDPRGLLSNGMCYEVQHKRVYDWHTTLILVRYPKHRFNSVCFEEVSEG